MIKTGLSVLMYAFIIYLYLCVSNIPNCHIEALLRIILPGLDIPSHVYEVFPVTFDKLFALINLYKTEESYRITFCKQQLKYYKGNEIKSRKWNIKNGERFIVWIHFF